MRITLTHSLPRNRAYAGSSFSVAASFYNDSDTLTAPTSARYRVWDELDCKDIIAWTTITPATTATISIPGTETESECDRRLQLIVEADTNLVTQTQAIKRFIVESLPSQ